MTDKPIPTAEVVEAFARSVYKRAIDRGDEVWEELPDSLKHSIRSAALDRLVDVYPQIVADVLNHYADTIESNTLGHLDAYMEDERGFAEWLRTQATGATA